MNIGINFERIVNQFHFTLNARDPNFIYQIIFVNTILLMFYFSNILAFCCRNTVSSKAASRTGSASPALMRNCWRSTALQRKI